MKKHAFCLVLCLLLLCGCRKTTYISREDQLAQRSTDASTTVQTSDISADTGTDGTTADINSLPPASSDSTDASNTSKATDDETETDALNDTESTKGSWTTKATESTKSTESTKVTESTKATESTKSTESTKETENTNATENTHTSTPASVTDSTSSEAEETTDSTEPPETTEAPADDPYDISNYSVGSISYTTHAAMNEQRTAVGLGELALDGYLCAIASVRAYECSQYWSHNRLDGSYWNTVLGDYGYGYSAAAENLAQGGTGLDGATVVALWASSEDHLANMINPDYTRVGIASYDYNGMTYVACLFTG